METDLKKRFDIQKQNRLINPPPLSQMRKEQLKKLLQLLKQESENLCQAIDSDFGHRSFHETKLLEIIPAIQSIRYALKHLSDWVEPRTGKLPVYMKPAKAYVIAEPKGIVGIVVPWNYPIYLTLAPLVSAIAAGNSVMIRISERVPNTFKILEDLLSQIFSMQEVQIVQGDIDCSKAFVELPFDHLLFTGSTTIGREVMLKASKNLTPITLELGGKSPVFIAPEYPLETAVNRIMTGKLFNSGQTCIAPDTVYLQQGAESLFIDLAKKYVEKHYPNIAENKDYTAIISKDQIDRLNGLLNDAVKQGAKLHPLTEETESCLKTGRFPPYVITGVQTDMRIMQEEIFGSILPIISYADFEEAIEKERKKPHPLALYIFDENLRRANDIIRRIPSGGVTVNDTLLHAGAEDLPFGGIGDSGMGQYHGKAGFDTFTHYRSVFYQSHINGIRFMRPPFGKLIERFIDWVL